jgi:cellulose synthase/poly-beta-1,6-N-acetylglucosamine synthase-like glycosyltransferase
MVLITLLTSVLEIFLIGALLYYYFLLLASIPNRRQPDTHFFSQLRFALLVPAHNEAKVIAETVESLLAIDYPADLYEILVIADHCDDDTLEVASKAGAICYERNEGQRGRKGYALAWMLQRLASASKSYDAFVIFDADSRVNSEFLQTMNAGLVQGALVLQGQHIISNTDESLYNRLAAIDMRLNNRLRNKAKDNLSLSCRLMGDAMCFSGQVFAQYPWETYSLVEDMEYGLHIVRHGVRVRYAADAQSYGQAAGDWRHAEQQRLRWSGGFLDVRRRLAMRILADGLKNRDMALLDRAFELLLPSYSALVILTLLLLIVKLALGLLNQPVLYGDAILIAAAWMMLPLIGLGLDRAPMTLFIAYLFSPIYLAWRVWIGMLAFLRRRRIVWVRTPRHEER